MKVAVLLPLHHGLDYVYYALRSVMPYVDVVSVAYTSRPCYGRKVPKSCPETEEQMEAEALTAANDTGCKLIWNSGAYGNSRKQEAAMTKPVTDADLIIRLDADEIWDEGAVPAFIDACMNGQHVNRYCPPFRHFWRSFDYACYTPARAARGIRRDVEDGRVNVDVPAINHFGYARTPADMAAKFPVKWERPNEGWNRWYRNVFLKWTPDQADTMFNLEPRPCHPFDKAYWYDKTKLPEFMRDHPYWDMELIA